MCNIQSDINNAGKLLTDLQPPSADEVSRLIRNNASQVVCNGQHIPTTVIKSSVDLLASLIARLATLSFIEGIFPSRFKVAGHNTFTE